MAQKELSTSGSEVPAVQQSNLPALPPAAEIREVFSANFEGITPSFPTVKIPSGGALIWSVPGDGDEPEIAKEITGVIVDHYPVRAYWARQIGQGGGNVPPDCSSADARTGNVPRNEHGEYGECATCKFSQWGSAPEKDGVQGRGQACKAIHRVFMLTSESIFPIMLPLPPSSGERAYPGSFQTYMVKLGGKLKKSYEVATTVKLAEDKNRDGIKFGKAVFSQVVELNPEEKQKVKALRDLLAPAMRRKPFEFDEAAPVEAPATEGPKPTEKEPWE